MNSVLIDPFTKSLTNVDAKAHTLTSLIGSEDYISIMLGPVGEDYPELRLMAVAERLLYTKAGQRFFQWYPIRMALAGRVLIMGVDHQNNGADIPIEYSAEKITELILWIGDKHRFENWINNDRMDRPDERIKKFDNDGNLIGEQIVWQWSPSDCADETRPQMN